MSQLDQALLAELNLGVVALDADGRVASWNAWVQSASGISSQEAVGRSLEEIFPGRRLQKVKTAVSEALTSGSSRLMSHSLHRGVLPLRTRAGRTMIHDIAVAPVGKAPFRYALVQITDVTVAAERELILRDRQNARYAAVVDNAPDAILTVDAQGVVRHLNPAAAHTFGYSDAEIVGRPLVDFLNQEAEWGVMLSEALAGKPQHRSVEFVAQTKGGGVTHLEASASRWSSQTQAFVSVILRDVNARHAASEALQQLHEAAQASLAMERETAQLREQFIAVLGHDLRNPLASIDAGARILLRESANERSQKIITMMQRSVLRMAGLIDNVMDFARGRLGGGLVLRERPEDLGPIVDQVVAELRAAWPEREIRSRCDIDGLVICDGSRLSQLLSNLLANALTHGASDEPIDVLVGTSEGALRLVVANSGPDIPPEALARLFRPFVRGEVTPNKQGLGLGLFIASQIAQAHGGALTARSENQRVEFIFEMPID